MSARLNERKGFGLLLAAALWAAPDARFVFLCRGELRYERALQALAAAAPDRVALRLDFSDAVERRLVAGADAMLAPSL